MARDQSNSQLGQLIKAAYRKYSHIYSLLLLNLYPLIVFIPYDNLASGFALAIFLWLDKTMRRFNNKYSKKIPEYWNSKNRVKQKHRSFLIKPKKPPPSPLVRCTEEDPLHINICLCQITEPGCCGGCLLTVYV
jgi:hypothetical protein